MAETESASFRRKTKALKEMYQPVGSMEELRKKREKIGLPEDQKEDDEPAKEGKVMVTDLSGRMPHRHTAIVDEEGNGKTRRTFDDDPHEHDIAGGKVREGGLVPHIHELEEA